VCVCACACVRVRVYRCVYRGIVYTCVCVCVCVLENTTKLKEDKALRERERSDMHL
jgi:hypothetical protein